MFAEELLSDGSLRLWAIREDQSESSEPAMHSLSWFVPNLRGEVEGGMLKRQRSMCREARSGARGVGRRTYGSMWHRRLALTVAALGQGRRRRQRMASGERAELVRKRRVGCSAFEAAIVELRGSSRRTRFSISRSPRATLLPCA